MSAKIYNYTCLECANYYLEYRNDFLTVERFAEYHNWTEQKAHNVIKVGRIAQETRAEVLKGLKA